MGAREALKYRFRFLKCFFVPAAKNHEILGPRLRAGPREGAVEQDAQAAYGVLLAASGGFQKKAQIDLQGVRTVLALRSKYAEPKKRLTDPAKYYDGSFYREALR